MSAEGFAEGTEPAASADVSDAEAFSARPRGPEDPVGKPPELRALGNLLDSHDPVPPDLAGAAYSAVRRRWYQPRQELALVEDAVRTSAVRSDQHARVLTFRVSTRILEVDLHETTPGWYTARGMVLTSTGQAVSEGDVLLRHARGDSTAKLDEFGVFGVAEVPRGPLS